MGKKPTTTLAPAKYVAIGDILRQHCRSIDGKSVYDEGWNDRRLAEAADAPEWAVRNTRVSLMGLLQRGEPGTSDSLLAQLEDRVANLERLRGDLEARSAMPRGEGDTRGVSLDELRVEIEHRLGDLERWRTDVERRHAALYATRPLPPGDAA